MAFVHWFVVSDGSWGGVVAGSHPRVGFADGPSQSTLEVFYGPHSLRQELDVADGTLVVYRHNGNVFGWGPQDGSGPFPSNVGKGHRTWFLVLGRLVSKGEFGETIVGWGRGWCPWR